MEDNAKPMFVDRCAHGQDNFVMTYMLHDIYKFTDPTDGSVSYCARYSNDSTGYRCFMEGWTLGEIFHHLNRKVTPGF